jgi:excisionase family DNA binding protein
MYATRSPELLPIPVVAQRLNVSKATVYRWITEGRIPAVRLGPAGSPLRVPSDELAEWVYSDPTGLDAS